MKRFENVMFVPKGYVREIKPVCNGELDNLSIELMNKTSVVNLRESGAEVHMEELTKVCSGDFSWTETLFKVLVSMESCMRADLNSKMSVNHGGWEKMRNNVVECCLRFDSTIKLWDATRKESTLFQELAKHGSIADPWRFHGISNAESAVFETRRRPPPLGGGFTPTRLLCHDPLIFPYATFPIN